MLWNAQLSLTFMIPFQIRLLKQFVLLEDEKKRKIGGKEVKEKIGRGEETRK